MDRVETILLWYLGESGRDYMAVAPMDGPGGMMKVRKLNIAVRSVEGIPESFCQE